MTVNTVKKRGRTLPEKMVYKRQAKPKKDPKTDSLSEKDEMLANLKEVAAAETEKIENSHKRKFDEISEKLQSIEETVSKISKSNDDEKKINNSSNNKPKSAKKFALKNVFKNVGNFKEGEWASSKREEHFNVKWHMNIKRNESHLEFYVYCKPTAPLADNWSIDTRLDYKMMGVNYNNIVNTTKCHFDSDDGYGYKEFLKWEDVKDDYLLNNTLTVEVKIEVLKMTGFEKPKIRYFDESQKDVSDVVLVVNGTKFYVSKMYLASQSEYFKTLFFGNFSESKKSEIALTGIEPEDFQRFLEVLYGEPVIDDSTIEGILLVADMYNTPMVLKRCETFLLKKSKKEFKKKLDISTQYRLDNLKNQCLSKITTVANVRELIPGDLTDLDPSAVLAILQNCVFSQ
ncbi:hypothetical protein B9Z55_013357 [Caenorhabditis nigoni]|uniref:BTB domain-containing protein n=1 Tax=Caenorhabditis nigoni TaxID=1611254 RepID=A0A2G5U1V2_9PELO|nr:hypothetical protein B9Z55_013357 [Caenorhabditis nigoni]